MPRLHVLHRPETPFHVVLRLGSQKGKKVSAAFGWDWTTDRITPAQWLGGRIYPMECDLSPCGEWMYYNALNAKWDDPVTQGSYGVLSRAPWFKAEALWPFGDRWASGMLIRARSATLSPEEFASDASSTATSYKPALPAAFGTRYTLEKMLYRERLLRDGWTLRDTRTEPGGAFHDGERVTNTIRTFSLSTRGQARLERHNHVEPLGPRPFTYDTHALVDAVGTRHERPSWEWAQVDRERDRLVWAEDGQLWAGQLNSRGLYGEPRRLYDFRGLRFQRRQAPY